MGYRFAILPSSGTFDAHENLEVLVRDLGAVVGHPPDRGELLALRERLGAIAEEIEGAQRRSFTPGPGAVNARSLIRAVLKLTAGAWIEVDIDAERRIVGVRIDNKPISQEQWDQLGSVGLRMGYNRISVRPGAYSSIDSSRKAP